MKLTSTYPFALFSLFALLFISCENEPLEGEFVSDTPDNTPASFTAEVDGVEFVADSSYAVTQNSVTTITGVKLNGDRIVMTVQGVGVGSFNLTGNEGVATFGILVAPEAFSTDNPGGTGQLVITNYDAENNVASGTFSFVALRPLLDNNGLPILDGNGNPTFDTVVINEGQFTNISLTTDGSGPPGPLMDFYAEVDGTPFIAGEGTAGAFYDETSNTLIIQGVNNSKIIQMNIANPGEETFDLGATSGNESIGSYIIEGQNPYISALSEGGSGSVTITTFDMVNNVVSGTFAFTAGRGEGTETVVIENGYFENLPVTLSNPIESDFYADINGDPYTPGGRKANYLPELSTIDIEGFVQNSIEMIRIRIKDPGIGTFVFEPYDNDTFAFYIKPAAFIYTTNLHPDGEGLVTITIFDLENNLISGTFEFLAVNDDDETVDVTNGSFNNVPIIIE